MLREKHYTKKPLPPRVVEECNIYGDKNPWDLFDQNRTEYIFTKLKKKSKAKIDRRAGSGTWKSRSTKPCPNHKNPLWFKKDFVFEVNDASRNKDGHWLMMELSLNYGGEVDNYVLCRICYKHSHNKREIITDEEALPTNLDAQFIPYIENKRKPLADGDEESYQNQKTMRSCYSNIVVEGQSVATPQGLGSYSSLNMTQEEHAPEVELTSLLLDFGPYINECFLDHLDDDEEAFPINHDNGPDARPIIA
ncbi:hypothetical protein GH714_008346 [Hevea brasiliensis]|uniref:NAC domain-containing protein n=1 Tax=Hevea brasiliensis TaxID=3981 RepID=A0A6A6N206_HEVBR|nr:hypothetical protein GH714_008346 [Hevea brasiliensis]